MATKKSFKDENPALRFISPPSGEEERKRPADPAPAEAKSPAAAAPPPGPIAVPMKPNPLYIETRSRRLNLLLQPSLHEAIRTLAAARRTSVNDLVHGILQEYADREG